eukprot:COSAG01_NODE_99_length_26583_cov_79.512536_29_plen_121_part_00
MSVQRYSATGSPPRALVLLLYSIIISVYRLSQCNIQYYSVRSFWVEEDNLRMDNRPSAIMPKTDGQTRSTAPPRASHRSSSRRRGGCAANNSRLHRVLNCMHSAIVKAKTDPLDRGRSTF